MAVAERAVLGWRRGRWCFLPTRESLVQKCTGSSLEAASNLCKLRGRKYGEACAGKNGAVLKLIDG